MKTPKKQFFYHVLIAVSLAFTIFIAVYLLAQNKALSQEIKNQTDINQRYLRCILLIERDQFSDVEKRVAAIDKCAIQSKTPNGQNVGSQPTSKEQTDYNTAQPSTNKASSGTPAPTTPTPAQPKPVTQPTQSQPAPKPSVVESVVNTVTAPIRAATEVL